MSSHYEWTRLSYQCVGPLLDAHRWSSRNLQELGRRWTTATVSQHSIDGRRLFKLGGCWIDDGYGKDHRCAPDEVIRPLTVIAAPRSPKVCPRLHLDYAWPDLADKASEPSRVASYPLSYLSWQGLAKSSARSEQMASWFTGWVCHADVIQAVAVCSALPRKSCRKGGIEPYLVHTPLSDGPGEPSVATRDPGGRSQRPPDCSDGMDGADAKSPAWVKGTLSTLRRFFPAKR